MMKLLVTGSRAMPFRIEVLNALSEWYIKRDDDPKVTLLHGDCEHPPLEKTDVDPQSRYLPVYKPRSLWSVDQLALETAQRFEWKHEAYPAVWYNSCTASCYHRKYANGYCPAAGPKRNKVMVDELNPKTDVVIGFPYGKSSGTRGCIKLAEKAGLEVIVYEL
jgi:hypothetical protein